MESINRTMVKKVIASFSGQQNTLSVQKEYAELCDNSYSAAIFLSQLIYWSDKSSDPDGWIYKTYAEWEKELYIKERSLRRIKDMLVKKGYIQVVLRHVNGIPTMHWKVCYTVIDAIVALHTSPKPQPVTQAQTDPPEAQQEAPVPFGQNGRIHPAEAPVPFGQNGRIHSAEAPVPFGQNGRIHSDKMTESPNTSTTYIDYIHHTHTHSKQAETGKAVCMCAEKIYAVFKNENVISEDFNTFLTRQYIPAQRLLRQLAMSELDLEYACENYAKILALQKNNATWWKSRQNVYMLCKSKNILRFLPNVFDSAAFTTGTEDEGDTGWAH